jgi:hypothetical protein
VSHSCLPPIPVGIPDRYPDHIGDGRLQTAAPKHRGVLALMVHRARRASCGVHAVVDERGRCKLPSEQSGALDLSGDVVLSHLRITPGQENDASPATGVDVIGPESGVAAPPVEPTLERLQQVIEDLNSRFGSELGASDRVLLEHVLGGMSGDDELLQEAKVNSKENFLMVFSEPFEEEVMKTESSNKEFFERFFSDAEFRDALVRSVGEEFHRRHGGELAA